MNPGVKKLISGIVLLGLSIYAHNTIGYSGHVDVDKWAQGYLVPFMGKDSGLFFSALINAVSGVLIVVFFLKGLYRIMTFNKFIDQLEGKNTSGHEFIFEPSTSRDFSGSAIDNALRYRDAKMDTMSNESAAKFYKETSSLNNLANTNNSTSSYLNAKISNMSNEDAISFLRGK